METDSQQSAQIIISFQTPDNLITRPEISHWESKDTNAVNSIWHFCPVCSIIFRTHTSRYGRHFQVQVPQGELKAKGKRRYWQFTP